VKCFRLLQEEEEEEEEAIISEGTLSVLKGKLAILSVSASASASVSLPPVRVGSCRITYGGHRRRCGVPGDWGVPFPSHKGSTVPADD
jgi:hypothetical protein